MTIPSVPIDKPAQPAPAEPSAIAVESKKGASKGKKDKDKVVLAREPSALDPTRFGDWEKNGRCIDF